MGQVDKMKVKASHIRHMKSKRVFNQNKANLDNKRKLSKNRAGPSEQL
jgi:hypothetical protein